MLVSAIIIISFISYVFLQQIKKTPEVPVSAGRTTNNPSPTDRLFGVSPTTEVPVPTIVTPSTARYKDGVYTGIAANAVYGDVQIRIAISNGNITTVQFLQYPKDQETSIAINNYAIPLLVQETVQAQSANVDVVTSATLTSQAFIQSLQSALTQAKG